jgi:hypothetical protein
MKLKAKASRDKRQAVRRTIDHYSSGMAVMGTAGTAAAQRGCHEATTLVHGRQPTGAASISGR